MTSNQIYYEPLEYLTTRKTGLSYIRILQASPDVSATDIYLNNKLISENFLYGNFTPYTGVNTGIYAVRIFSTGQTENPIIDTNVELAPNSIYTATILNTQANIELYVVPDPAIPPLTNRTRIRFVHLSYNTPKVDITSSNGMKLFHNVGYKEFTRYKSLTTGRYTMKVHLAASDTLILNVPNIILRPGRNLSLYAVGFADDSTNLQVLIPLDGSAYLPI